MRKSERLKSKNGSPGDEKQNSKSSQKIISPHSRVVKSSLKNAVVSPGSCKRITEYFKSTASPSSNKCDKDSVSNDEMKSTPVEEEVKVQTIHTVNNLFRNDLKLPKMSGFSRIHFSCSSIQSCKINHEDPVSLIGGYDAQSLAHFVNSEATNLLIPPLVGFVNDRKYLSPLIFRSLFCSIMVERDMNVCMQLVDELKKHIMLHPPCRRDLRSLYSAILSGSINGGDCMRVSATKYKFQVILNEIESLCKKLMEKDELNYLSLKSDAINGFTLDFKTQKGISNNQNLKNLLRKLFLIFNLCVDIIEENFRMWWVKSRYQLREKINSRSSRPFVAEIAWNKCEEIGSLNEHCIQVLMLYRICPEEYRHHIARYICILFESARSNEKNIDMKYPFFGSKCKRFAIELAHHIKDCDKITKTTLNLTRCLSPSWLRFKVCGVLLQSDLTSEGRDDLRSAYRIILRNLQKVDDGKASPISVKQLSGKLSLKMAKVNFKDPAGETALHKLCRSSSKSNLSSLKKYLMAANTNVNIKDNAGWTPVHHAAHYNNGECLKLLLKYRLPPIDGAEKLDLFVLNNDKDSPLACAVRGGHFEIVDLLLKNGAGPTIWNKNSKGLSPMDLAKDEYINNKLLNCWKENIENFELLRMKAEEVELLGIMISAYIETFHLKENSLSRNIEENKPDAVYSFDYAQYFKDEKTFERLLVVVERLIKVPGNPENLRGFYYLLKSCNL